MSSGITNLKKPTFIMKKNSHEKVKKAMEAIKVNPDGSMIRRAIYKNGNFNKSLLSKMGA